MWIISWISLNILAWNIFSNQINCIVRKREKSIYNRVESLSCRLYFYFKNMSYRICEFCIPMFHFNLHCWHIWQLPLSHFQPLFNWASFAMCFCKFIVKTKFKKNLQIYTSLSKKNNDDFGGIGFWTLFTVPSRRTRQVMSSTRKLGTTRFTQSFVVSGSDGLDGAKGSHKWLLLLLCEHIGVLKDK